MIEQQSAAALPALPRQMNTSRISFWEILEWGLLFAALALFTTTEIFQSYVAIGLGFLIASFTVRSLRTRRLVPRTGLEIPILLFLISGAVATWAAFDRPTALLQLARLLAVITLFYAINDSRESVLKWVAGGLIVASTYLAVFWLAQYDFSAEAVKIAPIAALGERIHMLLPDLWGPSIHSNVAGGTLALTIPFAVVMGWIFWRRKNRLAAIITGILGATILFGLVLTTSRGAWAGLAGAALFGLLVFAQQRWFRAPKQMIVFWGILFILTISILILLLSSDNTARVLGQIPDPSGAMQSRPRLWKESISMIRDFFITGSGLMSFSWVHSLYTILIFSRYLSHIHNTLLEIWIEQGVLGLAAVIWAGFILITWVWNNLRKRSTEYFSPAPADSLTDAALLGWAGVFSLVVVAIHSLFDVVLYVERTYPLIGLVLGYASLLGPIHLSGYTARRKTDVQRFGLLAIAALALIVAAIFHRSIISVGYANLGAIYQAKTEVPLVVDGQFRQLPTDDIRRTAELNKIIRAYEQSLNWDENNLTARQRLASIAFSQEQYDQALAYIEPAWQAGHTDRLTRMIYADALIARGEIEQAAELLQGVPWAYSRLEGQAWYHYWLGNDPYRAADAWRAALLLNSNGKGTKARLADAESRIRSLQQTPVP